MSSMEREPTAEEPEKIGSDWGVAKRGGEGGVSAHIGRARTPFVGWSKRIESEGLEFACAGLKFWLFC